MINLENKIPTTISSSEEKPKAMDFEALREEGIKLIQQLSPDLWTDHNLHDPGITLLEELCYAITDLAYRLDYPMVDLLAHKDSERNPYASLPPAYEIMPCLPVTLLDMRKLILDVKGVQNAWIERDQTPNPQLYYQDKKQFLTFSAKDAVPVNIKGLYKITIQPTPDYVGTMGRGLKEEVRKHWHNHRSLGEDLSNIEIVGLQNVTINAIIEINTVQQPNALMQKIFHTFTNYISPNPKFHDFKTMISNGCSKDELFSGPLLQYGFIDDDELQKSIPRSDLRTSDIIRVLMQLPEVRLVKQLEIMVQGENFPWFVEIENGKLPQLDILGSEIQLLMNGQPVGVAKKTEANKTFIDSRQLLKPENLSYDKRFPKPPKGEYRELSNYTSIQEHLPAIYGIGEEGLASDEPAERKAAAKQLKAYLLFFEQILANQHAQLEHFKDLFAYDQLPANSHFAQLLNSVPNVDQVLNPWLKLEGIQSDNGDRVYISITNHSFKDHDAVQVSGAGRLNGNYIISQTTENSLLLIKDELAEENFVELNAPHIRYSESQLLDLIRDMGDPVNTSNDRIHRFYDHLLARYGEVIPDYSSYFAHTDSEYLLLNQFLLEQKQLFLKQYKVFSQNRNKGFNYLEIPNESENIAGLQKRLQLLLGAGTGKKRNLSSAFENVKALIKEHYVIQKIAGHSEENVMILLLKSMTSFKHFSLNENAKVLISSPDRQPLAISKKVVAINPVAEEVEKLLLNHWKQSWQWNFSLEGIHLVEHILLRPIAADKESLDQFFHNYYLIESFEITEGNTDSNGDLINTLFCKTKREKPQKTEDVIYLSGIDDKQDIRAIVLRIDEDGFEIRLDSKILKTDHQKGFWYYGEAEREKAAIFMILHHRIDSFSPITEAGIQLVRCFSPNHGLKKNNWIDLQIEEGNSTIEQVFASSEDTFDLKIDKPASIPSWEGVTGKWQHANSGHDPYSLQITMLLPKWPGRMQDEEFRSLVETTIRNETPAHHKVYVRWLNLEEMRSFEMYQSVWHSHLQKFGI